MESASRHTDAELAAIALDFARLPFGEWEAAITTMDTSLRYEVERRLSADATRYARASAYLSRRMSGGKHPDAVKRQNQTARKVRQALGYTYADDAITF